jgi:tetratricopeptide (TPR) repeat protein
VSGADVAVEVPAKQTRVAFVGWRILLGAADRLGRAGRLVFVDARAVTALAALAPATYFALRSQWDEATAAAGVWVLGLLLLSALNARDRFIIGEFRDSSALQEAGGTTSAPAIDLANLLLVDISRLGDLFRVVGDRRAVSSHLGHRPALDATLSVDDLVETLQGTITAEAKASFGPISIPLAPLVTLFGKLLQAPRLSGNLHRDGGVLILTAQTRRRASLSWRVEEDVPRTPASGDPDADGVKAVVSGMVEELALRIYTDLALGRGVRWEASKSFVDGLHCFRLCLRTPKDRKVNLKLTEDRFLEALSQDEDFPLAYYNLGVVYTELHGLAVAAGRRQESQMRLSAAETSFGRAIQTEPGRWESYFAFAQTQFRYERYDSVVELCAHILTLARGWAEEARTRELLARALLERRGPDDVHQAIDEAQRASRLALLSLVRARLFRGPSSRGEDDSESRCAGLAAGCLLTFSDIYSRQMRDIDDLAAGRVLRWHQERIRRRAQSLAKLAPLPHGQAELRFEFGQRLLKGGHVDLAEEELAAAAGSDPTRPSYAAGLALARATRLKQAGTLGDHDRDQIVALCLRALQGMAGAFFPSRDARACRIVADVYDALGDEEFDDHETAQQLRGVAHTVDRKLAASVGGASVSGTFLEALQSAAIPLSSKVGEYGKAVQDARVRLLRGQNHAEHRKRAKAFEDFRQALESAERATSLNPLSTLAWETLGDVHRELSDFQNARIAWKQAASTDPDNPRLYSKIGSSYWHIAFQGRTRASSDDLTQAAEHFGKALLLYGRGNYDEQVLTHYRLGKLNAAQRKFGEARKHLEIVEAVGPPPIVGWQLLGFAYLELRNFSESEYYFGKVVTAAARLGKSHTPHYIAGDRLDEQFWPLALIRTWAHLGLAMTLVERDGDLERAEAQVDDAAALLAELGVDEEDPANDERFPTRAMAAIVECRGLIRLRAGDVDDAIGMLEHAVGAFPHSRPYFGLALALEQRALARAETRKDDVPRAVRLLGHAVSLGPTAEASPEVRSAIDRLARLNGS